METGLRVLARDEREREKGKKVRKAMITIPAEREQHTDTHSLPDR